MVDGKVDRSDGVGSPPGLEAFARAWAKAVTGTSCLPCTPAVLEAFLRRLTARLARALRAEPFDPRVARQVGADLVSAHITSAEGLGRTVEIIHLRLLRDLGLAGEDLEDRLGRLLGALAASYTDCLRHRTLNEQESIRRADLRARQQAEQALRDSQARFRHQATHDLLTGLPNRALFTERLTGTIDRGLPEGRVGVCLIDLDRFKTINDTLGHQVGDELLVSVGHRLRRDLGDHFVARIGVDEFAILLADTGSLDDAVKAADTALTSISEPALIGGHEIVISASIGVVERAVSGTTAAELIRDADLTLRWARTSGGA
ncbi:MAG TPA: GGDEF domain-containing protein, partial [Micromonospora sp.]